MIHIRRKAPTFLSILEAVAAPSQWRPSRLTAKKAKAFPSSAVGIAVSISLKTRCKHLCLLQTIISILLYAGHESKKVSLKIDIALGYTIHFIINFVVYIRLAKLGISVSYMYTTAQQAFHKLGKDHDQQVLQWKYSSDVSSTGKQCQPGLTLVSSSDQGQHGSDSTSPLASPLPLTQPPLQRLDHSCYHEPT